MCPRQNPSSIQGFRVRMGRQGWCRQMKARVFLSYARSDGTDACNFFHLALQNAGYSVWRDLDNMAGGDPPWQTIEETIRGVDAVLLFVTQGALDSPSVEREWMTAIRLHKRILPL